MKCKGSGSTRTCTAGGRTFTLHEGKSNKSAKARRGHAHGFKKADASACARSGKPGTVAFGNCMGRKVAARS